MIRLLNTLSEFRGWTIAERGFLVRARMFCARKNISNVAVLIPNRVFFITKYPETSNLAGIHLSISGFLTLVNTLRYTISVTIGAVSIGFGHQMGFLNIKTTAESSFFYHKVPIDSTSRWNPSISF